MCGNTVLGVLDKNRRAGHLHVKLLWKFLKKNLC